MNLNKEVSKLMTTDVITVNSADKLQAAKDVFDGHNIHHIPVLDQNKLVGMMSKSDYLYFIRPLHPDSNEPYLNKIRLKNYTIEEAMTKRVVTISSKDTLKSALEILTENLFHALPVVDNDKLVGIITTHDILFKILHPSPALS